MRVKKEKIILFILSIMMISIFPQKVQAYTKYYDDGTYYCWIKDDDTIDIRKYKGNERSVLIPEQLNGRKVTSITEAFYLNKTIEEVVIPDTVKSLSSAFQGCDALRKVKLSSNINYMSRAFWGCTQLLTITIPASYSNSFDYNGGNYENFLYSGLKNVIFEAGTKAIHNHIFDGCNTLETVNMPDSVNIIGQYAFGECSKLKVNLPRNLEYMGAYAFYNCKSITNITIPKTLEKCLNHNYGYFQGTSLKDVVIEEGTKVLIKNLFKGCTGITEITIPNSIVEIGETAFYGCTGMKILRMSDSVKKIGKDLWKNNFPNIEKIYLTASSIKEILDVGGLLGTGDRNHTFVSSNDKVALIDSNKPVLTYVGQGDAIISDSSGKNKRVIYITITSPKKTAEWSIN